MVLVKSGINGLQTEDMYAQLGRLQFVSRFSSFALLVPVDHLIRPLFSERCAVPRALMMLFLALAKVKLLNYEQRIPLGIVAQGHRCQSAIVELRSC